MLVLRWNRLLHERAHAIACRLAAVRAGKERKRRCQERDNDEDGVNASHRQHSTTAAFRLAMALEQIDS
jgi:hypothetical protein